MENTMVNEMNTVLEEVVGNEEVVVEVVNKSNFGRNTLVVAAVAGAVALGYKAYKKVKKNKDAKDADITNLKTDNDKNVEEKAVFEEIDKVLEQ